MILFVFIIVKTNINSIQLIMNDLKIKGNWNEVVGKLKQKYSSLSDDDLAMVEGKEDEFLGRLQKKLGVAKEELIEEIESL